MDYFDNSALLTNINAAAQPQQAGNKNDAKYFLFGFLVASAVAIVVYKVKSSRKKEKNSNIPAVNETAPPSVSIPPITGI